MLKDNIFRAYDIRWIVGKEFDADWAYLIWRAYAAYLIRLKKSKSKLNIVIWRDGRLHSEMLQSAFIKGLIDSWVNVVNIWLAPSPLLYYSIHKWGFDGWVNVTASHNPKEYNWFKLQGAKSVSIFGEQIQEILQLIKKGDFESPTRKWEESFGAYFPQYMLEIKSILDKRGTWSLSQQRVVVDAWNGVCGPFASLIFGYLGYDTISMYCDIDGEFPNHPADPEDANTLKDLQARVIKEWAALWFAFDWDWDRLWLVDSEWKIYNADMILILLARDLFKRNPWATVVYELNITGVLAEIVEKCWGKAVMCKTGHSYVEHEMELTWALLGWENSGHLFFWEDYYGFDDAIYWALLVAHILLRTSNMKVGQLLADLPQTYSQQEKFVCPDETKFDAIAKIAKVLSKKYDVNPLDWVRLDFDDRSWVVIRASNTSPKIQLRVEARSLERSLDLKNEMIEVIEKALKSLKHLS